jgi:hypothetical protein
MYWSATIGAITGACNVTDWSELFTDPADIVWCEVLSSATHSSAESYFCFGTKGGEIFVYAGDNPNAANWEQVAKFNTSSPLLIYTTAALAFKNDVWLATKTGVISLRLLLQTGDSQHDQFSVSQAIDPLWGELSSNKNPDDDASLAYWPEQNKVYILRGGFVDNDGTYTATDNTMYVYNIHSGAWVIHRLEQLSALAVGTLTYFKDNLYFGSSNSIMTIDKSGFKDEVSDNEDTFAAYEIQLNSAYSQLGQTNKYKQTKTIEPVIDTDFAGTAIGVQVAADFGRKTSATTNVPLVNGFNFPVYNVGVQGAHIQYRLTGTSDTTASSGYKLYSMGVSIK